MNSVLVLIYFIIFAVGVFAAPPRTTDDLQQDIDWAVANTTKLSYDINNLHNSELLYFEYLAIVTANDFLQIKKLLYTVEADPIEIGRLVELIDAMESEIRLLIEHHLSDSDTMQFQCIRILSSLKLNLLRLHREHNILNEMMELLMQDLSMGRIVINSLYSNVRSMVLELIEGMSGSDIDTILQTLEKIQDDLGIKSSQVQAVAMEASQTKNELTTILEWIISQLSITIHTIKLK